VVWPERGLAMKQVFRAGLAFDDPGAACHR